MSIRVFEEDGKEERVRSIMLGSGEEGSKGGL
jgi:hypothetical protein